MNKLQVFESPCKNCLFSKDAIVSPERVKEVLRDCKLRQTYFICHKSDKVCCHTFYEKLGHKSQFIRIVKRLNMVEFVPHSDNCKLPSWKEMKSR